LLSSLKEVNLNPTEHPPKIFVLDTNVLLSDPNAIYAFEENAVVLPLIVIEELDRHKDRMDDAGKNARENHRRISKFKNLKTGVTLETGGTLRVVSYAEQDNVLPVDLAQDKPDNIILSVCIRLKSENPDIHVVLVTKDLLLKIKGESLGIECEDYLKYNVATSSDNLYSGVRRFTGVVPGFVDEFYANESASARTDLPKEFLEQGVLHPNEFLVVKDAEGKSAVISRFKTDKDAFTKISDHTAYGLKPKNKEQNMALDLLLDDKVKLVSMVGLAGSGKTLLSLAAGLEQVINQGKYKRLVILRPIQPLGKDIGFLPGTVEEKMGPWLSPIKDNLMNLMFKGKKGKNEKDTLDMLIEKGTIEIEVMTYIRGRSISDSFMIIDETQNISPHEIKTIITRVGENTKIVLNGDVEQLDVAHMNSVSNGLAVAVERFKESSLAGHITLVKSERSALAAEAALRL
jgi:PhoH-like ATPase